METGLFMPLQVRFSEKHILFYSVISVLLNASACSKHSFISTCPEKKRRQFS